LEVVVDISLLWEDFSLANKERPSVLTCGKIYVNFPEKM